MGAKTDPLRKRYVPLLDKTLEQALAHRIATEFPRIGGERILILDGAMGTVIQSYRLGEAEPIVCQRLAWIAGAQEEATVEAGTTGRDGKAVPLREAHARLEDA